MESKFTSTNKNLKVDKKDKPLGVIYARVSSSEQVENTSLETQIEKCTKKLSEVGAEIVGQFIEEGESAKTTDRTQFQNLLSFIALNKNKISYVCVYKLDRWARDTADFHLTKSFIVKNGASLISVLEPLSDDPSGRFLETVLAASAQLDNELKGLRVKDSMERKALDGWPTNKVCYGYKNDKEKRITICDPNFYEPIKDILHMFINGYSIPSLAKYLNVRGLKTKPSKIHSSREFAPKDVWKILNKSKFYAGYFNHRGHNEDILGKYVPMITWEEHLIIQSKLHNKPIVNVMNTDETNTYILNFKIRRDLPFLTCTGCGERLRTTVSRGNGGNYAMYYCKNPQCTIHKKTIWKSKLEELMVQEIAKLKPTSELIEAFKIEVKEEWSNKYEQRKKLEEMSSKRLEELKEERVVLSMKNVKGLIDDETLKDCLKQNEIETLTQKVVFHENRIDLAELELLLAYAEVFINNLQTLYNSFVVEYKRIFLHLIFPKGVSYADGVFHTNEKPKLFEYLEAKIAQKPYQMDFLTSRGIEPRLQD